MVDLAKLSPTEFLLYADDGYDSHVVRFLLEEKQLPYHMVFVHEERPEIIAELNPYATLPILANRDVVLYELNIIFEYLEERHKAHPLMPNTPKDKAFVRQLAWRLQKDWLALGRVLMTHPDSFNAKQAHHAKKTLSDSLITLTPLFARHEFFMSDDFGWCDILLLPLLYRLPSMGIVLPVHLCQPLIAYQQRLIKRSSFQKTLLIQESDDV